MSAWLSGHALALAAAEDHDADRHRSRAAEVQKAASLTLLPDADAAIVAGIRAGDEGALDALVDRYYAGLVTYAEQLLGSDAADDLVQELFIRLWRRREAWGLRGSLRIYLYSAVRNAAHNARAAQRSRSKAEASAAPLYDALQRAAIPTPPETLEFRELMAIVARTVSALPGRSREVYLLARTGLNSTEIGSVLGIAPSTVRTLLGRAIAALDRAIGPLLLVLLLAAR
jgi:RNA polymerase sigma-70 factor (ECF subfamily)